MQTQHWQLSFRGARQGFALVLALTLMAFITLIVLSLGALAQVQIQTEAATETKNAAQANARLALLLALGELQKQAGPDRRATATGEAAGEAAPKNLWTGVWNTGAATPQPAWLVSNAGTFTEASEVEFLSFLDSTQRVRVPRVKVSEGDANGHYAWWIADEGVKAKINVIDPYRDMAAANSQQAPQTPANKECDQRARYRLLCAQETGIALLQDTDGDGNRICPSDPAVRSDLSQLFLTDQIDLLQGGSDGAEDAAAISHKTLFHDVTVHGHGVLADMSQGGLKTDLSLAFASNAAAPSGFEPQWWNRLKDYYNSTGQSELAATVATDGNRQHIFPVPVKMNYMIAMFLSESPIPANQPGGLETFASGKTGKSVYVGLSFELSLHNPYNVKMVLPHGFRAEVLLPAENNSTATGTRKRIQVASALNTDGTRRSDDELENALQSGGLDRFYVSFDYDKELVLEPGQTRLFSIDNGAGAGAAYKHVNISGLADAAVAAKLEASIRSTGSPDYVYKKAQIANSNGDDGLYIIPAQGVDQSYEVILRLDSDSSLQLQTRLGLLDKSGNVQGWFSGIRTPLALDTAAPPEINSRTEWSGTFSATVSAPSGGFSLSYEMPMSRRKSVSGSSLRPLVDYNMRAVPDSLNASSTSGLVSYITPYYRVPTVITSRFTGMRSEIKWTHFDLFHSGADNPRQRAMIDPESVLMPGKANSSRATYGWAGPSPYGTEGSAKSKLRDVNTGSIYFDIPSEKPFSLGALRHAQVFDHLYAPAYSVGCSYAPAFSANAVSVQDDLHRLNQMLWDGYFFSSITPDTITNWSTSKTLPNSRIEPRPDLLRTTADSAPAELSNSQTAAGQLMVNGAFNVNSTSVAAWRAVLASMRNTLADYRSDSTLTGTPYSRFSRSLLDNSALPYTAGSNKSEFSSSGENDIGTGSRQYIYNGIRLLTDSEIDTLAQNIVREIIERGSANKRPFLGMADFVNRQLEPVGNEPVTQLKGLLQLAIDDGPWHSDSASSIQNRWTPPASAQEQTAAINADVFKNDQVPKLGLNGLVGKSDSNQYPLNAHSANYLNLEPRSADAPAALSQGDILAALAPVLNARSDIFAIRAYGDAVGADGTTVLARAWCEAIVQRIPDPVVRKSQTVGTPGYYEPSAGSEETLGRKFVVLSFRWLTDENH